MKIQDDVIINKILSLKRCVKRVEEEYAGQEVEFLKNYTKQDSAILNILRACELTLDIGNRIIKIKKLSIPQSNKEIFEILCKDNLISSEISEKLKNMVGFRNIATHDYQKLEEEILLSIIKNNLVDFIDFINEISILKI